MVRYTLLFYLPDLSLSLIVRHEDKHVNRICNCFDLFKRTIFRELLNPFDVSPEIVPVLQEWKALRFPKKHVGRNFIAFETLFFVIRSVSINGYAEETGEPSCRPFRTRHLFLYKFIQQYAYRLVDVGAVDANLEIRYSLLKATIAETIRHCCAKQRASTDDCNCVTYDLVQLDHCSIRDVIRDVSANVLKSATASNLVDDGCIEENWTKHASRLRRHNVANLNDECDGEIFLSIGSNLLRCAPSVRIGSEEGRS